MNSPDRSACPRAPRFVSAGSADVHTATRLRKALAQWLRDQFMIDEVRVGDIVLTVYEALANATEFAYLDSPGAKAVRVEAEYSSSRNRLEVTVSDHGRWREIDPALRPNTRGRGIPLMAALASSAIIEKQTSGTVVRLRFNELTVRTADDDLTVRTADVAMSA